VPILLFVTVAVFIYAAFFQSDTGKIERAMRKQYYEGYVDEQKQYLYFGENDKVAMGVKVKNAFVMTKTYTYKVEKEKSYYVVKFAKKRYRLQINEGYRPSRMFGLDDEVNYTLKGDQL
jgi:hypothetical protein